MKVWKNAAVRYLAVSLLVILFYTGLQMLGLEENGMELFRTVVLIYMLAGMVFLIRCLRYASGDKAWEQNQVLAVLCSMGILLRITYMLYTPCTVRSHDLWQLDADAYGHAAYILKLMQRGQLPETNAIQFYQQPLFYLLGSAVSYVINGITNTSDAYHLVDATKTVSCAASCISLLVSEEIFVECGLSGKSLYRAMFIMTFLPAYFLSGGRVGPDSLAAMFMLLAFLYTMKWIKEKSWKNTIVLALCYGCGMMTKISCAVLALFTALIFLVSFEKAIREGSWKPLLLKYVVFGAISLPLGLWYSIRNFVLFQQPFNYVLEIPKDHYLYKGNVSVAQRILVIKLKELFSTPYANVRENYNLPVYALKSALFGEFSFENWGWISGLLLFFAFLLSAFCVLSIVWWAKENRKEKWCRLMLLAAGIFYGSILFFYLRYPFGCSMDFRYMLFLPMPMAYLFGRCKWLEKGNLSLYADISCIGFAITSCMVFC